MSKITELETPARLEIYLSKVKYKGVGEIKWSEINLIEIPIKI